MYIPSLFVRHLKCFYHGCNGRFSRGGRGRRGRGGRGRGRGKGPVPTAEELDAELEAYNKQVSGYSDITKM